MDDAQERWLQQQLPHFTDRLEPILGRRVPESTLRRYFLAFCFMVAPNAVGPRISMG